MVTYTDTTDKLILIAVLQELKPGNPTSEQWNSINERLGLGSTASGLSQRYSKKIMKIDVASGQSPASGKRKGSPSVNTPASNKKSKIATMDDDNEVSPAKLANAKKQKKPKVKEETKQDDDFDAAESYVSPVKQENGDSIRYSEF